MRFLSFFLRRMMTSDGVKKEEIAEDWCHTVMLCRKNEKLGGKGVQTPLIDPRALWLATSRHIPNQGDLPLRFGPSHVLLFFGQKPQSIDASLKKLTENMTEIPPTLSQ